MARQVINNTNTNPDTLEQAFAKCNLNYEEIYSLVFDKIAPTLLTATVVDDAQIDLAWTINSVTADGHKIYISTDNVNFTLKGTVLGATAVYSATELSNFTQYYFKVVAYKGNVESTAAQANGKTLYAMYLEATGTGEGVSTLMVTVSANITATLTGSAKFYSDAAGTLDESATWNIATGAERTIYLKCTTGTAKMIFSDITKLTGIGSVNTNGWVSGLNAPNNTINLDKLSSLDSLRSTGKLVLQGLTNSLRYINLNGYNIQWNYSGALPKGLFLLQLNSDTLNWTGLDISGTGNITIFSLGNYRQAKMTSAEMITLLTSLKNRVGSLPASITINDYADYASPPQSVLDAVAALKLAKSITTVNLGA